MVMLSNHLILCHPFSFCLQSFLASGSFPMSWLFASGGQIIRVSASASVLPMNIQSSFPFGLTVLISLLSKGLSRVFSCTTLWKHQLSHLYLTTGKMIALTIWTFVGKVMSLLFNTQSRFFTAFLPRSKCLLISWLQSLQWFWSPRKENLSLFPLFSHLFARKRWVWMPWWWSWLRPINRAQGTKLQKHFSIWKRCLLLSGRLKIQYCFGNFLSL